MSIIKDAILGKSNDGAFTQQELQSYHQYGGDILADGFVSPIVLPCDRLAELKGDMSISELAQKCHVPARELQMLLDNTHVEPTPRQLAAISMWCGVSILWLLGYHTTKTARNMLYDKELLSAVAQRNAAEQAAYRVKEKGFIGALYQSIANRRATKMGLAVYNTAARLVASEHIPLSEQELYLLCGQPVFIEHRTEAMEWGLVVEDGILVLNGKLYFDDNGESYEAYQTPDTTTKI